MKPQLLAKKLLTLKRVCLQKRSTNTLCYTATARLFQIRPSLGPWPMPMYDNGGWDSLEIEWTIFFGQLVNWKLSLCDNIALSWAICYTVHWTVTHCHNTNAKTHTSSSHKSARYIRCKQEPAARMQRFGFFPLAIDRFFSSWQQMVRCCKTNCAVE